MILLNFVILVTCKPRRILIPTGNKKHMGLNPDP